MLMSECPIALSLLRWYKLTTGDSPPQRANTQDATRSLEETASIIL